MESNTDTFFNWFRNLSEEEQFALLSDIYDARLLLSKGIYSGPAPEIKGINAGPAPQSAQASNSNRCPYCGR